MTQAEALDILKMGHNAFLTGAAGSGKTYVLNQYINYLKENGATVGITASTGVAATHMGGTTIHAWSGLGIKDSLSEGDIDDLEERQYLWNRFKEAQVLIIDEVSMLHHFRLDLVERIIRSFKRNNFPFGGMQVILCGDFFQLPPVSRQGEMKARFAYHSQTWQNLELKVCYLEEQHRQNDKEYLAILNAVRDGEVNEEIFERLKSRFNQKPESSILPTKLYSHNINVDAENDREIKKLAGEIFEYQMSSRGADALVATLKKGCLAPERLQLKKEARVMFVKNSFESGYANGTMGVVIDCSPSSITVKTVRGKIIEVMPGSWQIEEAGKVKAEITQYPLRLAWAITVHKSQGMSLDAAEVDLSRSFEKGMGYVALSRLRTLNGLQLMGINNMALEVDEEVAGFDSKFRESSSKHVTELSKKNQKTILRQQQEFLAKITSSKFPKEKKISTEEVTLKLLENGQNIRQIAKERNLKPETIISHIEKLKEKDKTLDLSILKKEISASRLQKIITALKKSGMEGGVYLLTPAKQILGNGFSFEEIRMARLFL